ncbi:hypothetical protein SGLAD_v1c03670 [Spiroplasma gladiatoris]|uniref:Uncharacterized protein n=1 Tax=Spiroplasma gladiatoris TaxID=2143 RepID=A0A4P7AIT8_9MOLU|nr:hypothetical protein [Spiroplasma gladiatoris]QBQ07566.1 hypothetical protein SGLAD_v1c03670 [Spiroplasma gladiatoris]
MEVIEYYSIGTALVILFLIGIVSITTGFLIKKNNNKKIVKQITKIPYFTNEGHGKEKWWVSNKGELEKKGIKSQDFNYKIAFFNYYENFSKDFFNSKYVRTKSYLIKFLDIKSTNKTIAKLKLYTKCLENIWWKKYRIFMKESLEEIPTLTSSPAYFFYKYYFMFLQELRKTLAFYLTNHIIPNTIFLELKTIHFEKFGIRKVSDPKKNIAFAFMQVVKESETLIDRLSKQFFDELENKGKDWSIDYKNNHEIKNVFKENDYIKKIYLKQKSKTNKKKYNVKQNVNNNQTKDLN